MVRPKIKKKARYMNFYLSEEVAQMIDNYSEQTGIPKTRIVENAVKKYFQTEQQIGGTSTIESAENQNT